MSKAPIVKMESIKETPTFELTISEEGKERKPERYAIVEISQDMGDVHTAGISGTDLCVSIILLIQTLDQNFGEKGMTLLGDMLERQTAGTEENTAE